MTKDDNRSCPMVLLSAVFIFANVLLACSFSQDVTGRVHAILNNTYMFGENSLSHMAKANFKEMDDFQSFAVHISFSIEKSLYLQVQVEVDHLYIYQLVYQNLMKLLIVHIIVKELR